MLLKEDKESGLLKDIAGTSGKREGRASSSGRGFGAVPSVLVAFWY